MRDPKRWRVRLGCKAEADFVAAVVFSRDTFGTRQAAIYAAIIRDALVALEEGPLIAGSVTREDIFPGLRSLHVARRGRHARHVIFFRIGEGDDVIDVLRILHDAMEMHRHLPKA